MDREEMGGEKGENGGKNMFEPLNFLYAACAGKGFDQHREVKYLYVGNTIRYDDFNVRWKTDERGPTWSTAWNQKEY